MSTFFFVLLGIIVACSLVFGVALFWRSLEDADFWLKAFSAVLGALIFAVGMAALITGHFAGKEQGRKIDAQQERMLGLEKDLAEAKTKQAEAELALAEVQRKQAPRTLSTEKFSEVLRESLRTQPQPRPGFLQQRITVLYQREDIEAFAFAGQIASALYQAGWRDVGPEPLPSGAGGPSSLPTVLKLGGDAGLSIVPQRRIHGGPDEAEKLLISALLGAFAACGLEAKIGGLPYTFGNLAIIVGPKP